MRVKGERGRHAFARTRQRENLMRTAERPRDSSEGESGVELGMDAMEREQDGCACHRRRARASDPLCDIPTRVVGVRLKLLYFGVVQHCDILMHAVWDAWVGGQTHVSSFVIILHLRPLGSCVCHFRRADTWRCRLCYERPKVCQMLALHGCRAVSELSEE
jgi:hypothetical protein